MRPNREFVDVFKTKQNAFYSGLIVCGSIWHCPVCAAKITERRRVELKHAETEWLSRGNQILMLTQTLPHYLEQPLKAVLEGFSQARKLMRNRKPWKALSKRIRIAHTNRSLEVTHGKNGWHVHAHELLYIEGKDKLDLVALEAEILTMWRDALATAWGFLPNGYGIKIQNGDYASKYASKWGLDCEMTKGHIKRGRDGNYTPWDLLRRAYAGDEEAGALFREYAKAFKGKQQLVWSNGARKALGLGAELSDAAIASEVDDNAILLGQLSWSDWKKVLRADLRGELLEVANKSGWRGVMQLIRNLYTGESTNVQIQDQ